jgi:GNAT superfamily N-acetyltransferase
MPLVSVTRTYLELTAPDQLRASGARPEGARVEAVERVAPELFRWLYTTVGGPWHWRDRLPWTDADIEAHFRNPGVALRVLTADGVTAGYYELARQADGSVEIVHFGLVPERVGMGLGGFLLAEAVRDAWETGAARVWLHTCTLDGPAALPNYLARGFTPYKTEQYTADIP